MNDFEKWVLFSFWKEIYEIRKYKNTKFSFCFRTTKKFGSIRRYKDKVSTHRESSNFWHRVDSLYVDTKEHSEQVLAVLVTKQSFNYHDRSNVQKTKIR